MATWDTAIAPVSVTPSDTNNATLFTASAATLVTVTAANLTDAAVEIRIGITPSGGSVHWKVYDFALPGGESLELGSYPLRSGDAVTVRTASANDVEFSAVGLVSS